MLLESRIGSRSFSHHFIEHSYILTSLFPLIVYNRCTLSYIDVAVSVYSLHIVEYIFAWLLGDQSVVGWSSSFGWDLSLGWILPMFLEPVDTNTIRRYRKTTEFIRSGTESFIVGDSVALRILLRWGRYCFWGLYRFWVKSPIAPLPIPSFLFVEALISLDGIRSFVISWQYNNASRSFIQSFVQYW